MGKKGKKNSKPKNTGKSKSPEKKPQIDPQILKDLVLRDVFRFSNGDVYLGQFILTPEGEILRHGRGKYFTAGGSFLVGLWDHDVLVEAERLFCADGSWYRGVLEEGRYSGHGVYGHPRVGTLECDFLQGRPEGKVTLTDRNDKRWEGHASSGSATLLPRNHFFDSEEALLHQRREQSVGKSSVRIVESENFGRNSRVLSSVEENIEA